MASQDFHKGAVFWLDAEHHTEDESGNDHFWVVLAVVDTEVLWVPLSSVKTWTRREDTYVFNVGKSNKYIDAKKTLALCSGSPKYYRLAIWN